MPALPHGVDTYSASKSEWVVMANAYVDLGTWWCVTPFVGAGVGMARKRSRTSPIRASIVHTGVRTSPASTSAYAADASKWNFAWASAHRSGLQGQSEHDGRTRLQLRESRRRRDGRRLDRLTAVTRGIPMHFKDITSHDLKLGVRWNLDSPPAYAPPPPLIRKG